MCLPLSTEINFDDFSEIFWETERKLMRFIVYVTYI
jgi:hypothetical protein